MLEGGNPIARHHGKGLVASTHSYLKLYFNQLFTCLFVSNLHITCIHSIHKLHVKEKDSLK